MGNSDKFGQKHYMIRCIQLARKGMGNTLSNPLVGSVVVHNEKIIGEGYHRKFGENHAEVNAIQSVRNKDLLKDSTIYVNLEPCSHSGKTPPCTDLILRSGIPSVVIGTIDTSSKSAGKGIERLRKKGCKVKEGILENECRQLNKRFFTFHEKHRPYVILKWAQSSDGFIDIKREVNDKSGPNWISGPYERVLVHKWRSEEQAILVGTRTVKTDNPELNVRDWGGNSPFRLVIDRTLKLSTDYKVFDDPNHSIVFTSESENANRPHKTKKLDFTKSIWPQIMSYLVEMEIASVLVEGGSKTLQSLISSGLWDEARVFTGFQEFEEGVIAPKIEVTHNRLYHTWQSDLKIYCNKS